MLAMQTEEDIRSIKRCGGSYRTLYTDLTEDHSDGSHLTPRDGPQCAQKKLPFSGTTVLQEYILYYLQNVPDDNVVEWSKACD
jgi:hypothetical protein